MGESQTLISEIARLLNGTLSYDKATVDSSAVGLDHLSVVPGFPLSLLAIAKDGDTQGLRIASATYLKNLIKRFINGKVLSPDLHKEFRNSLAEALLKVEPSVLKVLLEAFRLVIVKDFVEENSWPELIPQLKAVIQNSNLISQGKNCQWSTINALQVLQAIVRPFQYFLNPKVANEPVPDQLEQVATEIIVPLQTTFHHFVDKVSSFEENSTHVEYEQCVLLICKSMYFAVRSYMPSAIIQIVPSFCHDILRILETLRLEDDSSDEVKNVTKLKIAKRGLVIFCTLVTRHRKQADKLMQSIVNCAINIANQSTNLPDLESRSDRIISLAFDVISHVLETGPGWRLVSSHFSSLLDSAIFPALSLNQKDISEWEEDTEEYMRKNLPCELDEASGWAEDLFTSRKSARNLLGVIATSKGPPVVSAVSKRKKGEKNKGKQQSSSMGELLIIPFLSNFRIPSDGDKDVSSKSVQNYYGVLMAYGSLQDFLKEKPSDYTATLIRERVFPLYLLSRCTPYLIASANWILGELAPCLPPAMSGDVYQALLKALKTSDTDDINCYPVRASAAGALASLLDNEYFPSDWLALLEAVVGRIGTTRDDNDNESSLIFQLIASIIEAGQDKVAIHIPGIVATIAGSISKLIPPIPDPWPQMVEKGVASLVVLVQTWVASLPDESKQEMHNIASVLSNLLQQAWLMDSTTMGEAVIPPPSGINDASMLLGLIIQFTNSQKEVEEFKVKELLSAFADVIADYHAWEEMEDQGIFNTIKEAVYSSQKFVSSSVIPSSFMERVSKFISEGMNAYASATWRACGSVHLLLHVLEIPISVENENAKKNIAVDFARVAFDRFKEISDWPDEMWKALLLVISSCYVLYPDCVERVLEERESGGFVLWASKLAYVSSNSFDYGFSSEPEYKLAVLALAKVLDRLVSVSESKVLNDCFVSLMEASVRLNEMQVGGVSDDEDDDDEDELDFDDVDDDDDDEDEQDSEEEVREETEEEFLNRYAAAANDVDNFVEEEDLDDDKQIIDIGNLDDEDAQTVVCSLIKKHKVLAKGDMLSQSLISRVFELFPEYQLFLGVSTETWMGM
ncbi:hypothetical protein LUZ60_015807 [Juncus effusus]|nr:hypothetical protein LUZ60_015807 [Juncus effusus]